MHTTIERFTLANNAEILLIFKIVSHVCSHVKNAVCERNYL